MKRNRFMWLLCAVSLTTVGCGGEKTEPAGAAEPEPATAAEEAPAEEAPKVEAGKGFNVEKKVVNLGALNDESGPAATIGKPYAIGKRILTAQVNAGGTGLLPEGWKIQLVEKDHSYNPQKSVQAYNQVKDEVALILTSFGTPNTLPLRPMLERDEVVALPASLSSQMAAHKFTPPAGPSYKVEAQRVMDHVVEQAGEGGAAKIKAGIVYQQDDYGKDGQEGWQAAAKMHGVEIVSEQTVTPGQRDFTAVITGLKDKGATHVLLTVLPSATGPILANAAQLQYQPQFIGQTPTWIDGFFNPKVIPAAVFANYTLASAQPYWGEDLPGMDKFLAAFKAHGGEATPDGYILMSYIQGMFGLEAVKRAIEAGEPTRAGVLKALQGISEWNAGGLVQPISANTFPYVAGTATRVLKPDFEKKSWTVVAPFASPKTSAGAAAPTDAPAAPAAPAAPGAPAADAPTAN